MIQEYERCRKLIEQHLEQLFVCEISQKELTESMRYSLLAGGKRIRPVLVMQFCRACGGEEHSSIDAACAVEMLHTYSLIHDDLPCMDNDNLRRGKPTNHVVYGECTATLAGDALQAEAFRILLQSDLPAQRVVKMARFLADAAGVYGICGGQILDMQAQGQTLSQSQMENIHMLKTASLLQACCKIGVAAAGGSEGQLDAAEKYAGAVGLAFQVADDILDCTSTTQQLGKPVMSDAQNNKNTFVRMYGVEKCRQIILEQTEEAKRYVRGEFENTEFLEWFAGFLAERKY